MQEGVLPRLSITSDIQTQKEYTLRRDSFDNHSPFERSFDKPKTFGVPKRKRFGSQTQKIKEVPKPQPKEEFSPVAKAVFIGYKVRRILASDKMKLSKKDISNGMELFGSNPSVLLQTKQHFISTFNQIWSKPNWMEAILPPKPVTDVSETESEPEDTESEQKPPTENTESIFSTTKIEESVEEPEKLKHDYLKKKERYDP